MELSTELLAEQAELEMVWSYYNKAESHFLEEAKYARHAMDLAQKRIDELDELMRK